MSEAAAGPERQIEDLYRIALSRQPAPKELKSQLAFWRKQREYHLARASGSADLAALTDVAHVVLNSNEFVYID